MITVAILINGNPLMARSATNTGIIDKDRGGTTIYRCDTGQDIYHYPSDGAVALAHKLLDTIEE